MNVLGKYIDLSKVTLNYNSFIENMKNDVHQSAWFYQTCTEFGYYQTGNFDGSIFYPEINLDFFVGICKEVFFDKMLTKKLTL